jgi:hypothetical protein
VAVIILPSRRRYFPTENYPRIADGHWARRGLIVAAPRFDFEGSTQNVWNAVPGGPVIANEWQSSPNYYNKEIKSSRWGTLRGGYGTYTNTNYQFPDISAYLTATGAVTVIAIGRAQVGGNSSNGIDWIQCNGNDGFYPYINGNLYITMFYGTTRWISDVTPTQDIFVPHCMALTAKAGVQAFYLNGVVQGTSTQAGAPAMGAIKDLGNPGTTSTANQAIYSLFVWDHAKSAAEVQELSANPAQIFAAPLRRLYFAPAAGGGTTDAAIAGTQATDVGAVTVEATTGCAVAGTQASDVGAIAVEATTGCAIAGTQTTDVGAVAVEATTGCAVVGTQASDVAAVEVTAGTGSTDAAIAGIQASDVGAIEVEATLGLSLSGTQASDAGYIVVEATLPAAMAGTQTSDVAAITATTTVVVSIWTDVGVSAATWSDVGTATSIWTDL